MRKLFALFVVNYLFIGALHAEGCPSLDAENTLKDIIEIGLCRNPQTAAGYLSTESARLSKNAAYSNYLPQISASASATTSDRDIPGQGDRKLGDEWTKSASISADLLIFDFGKRYENLARLSALWAATGFDYAESVQNYVYSVIGAYYGLLTADADVKAGGDLVRAAAEAKATADKKFKAGAVAKADVLRAETNFAARKTDLQRSEGAREIAVARLLSLLSLSPGTEIKISDMPAEFGSATEIKDIKELIETAEKNRPDLKSAAASTAAARYARNAAFMQHLPTISATGRLSYDPENSWQRDETYFGLSVRVPIFTGFSNLYNDRAAMVNYERAKEQERAKLDSARLDVWIAFQNYKTAREVLESTNALLKSATESEKVAAGMYKAGRGTMLDWQTAQADLASAQKQNAGAKYDLFIKRAAMAMSVGDLVQ
jgi:outer membrane protein TolC